MWEFMMIAHKMPHENVFDDDAKKRAKSRIEQSASTTDAHPNERYK